MKLKNSISRMGELFRPAVLLILGVYIVFFSEAYFDLKVEHRNILGWSLIFYVVFKWLIRRML